MNIIHLFTLLLAPLHAIKIRPSLSLWLLGLAMTAFAAPLYAADDYSDAPASYGVATHTFVAGTRLGATITTEASAILDADNASDDGVILAPLTTGATSYTIPASTITVTGTGNLYAWVDFNGNGTFEATEFASTTVTANVVAGNLTFSGFGMVTASGSTYVRLRFTSNTLTSANAIGAATDGEVEDYAVSVATLSSYPPDPNLATCPMDSSSTYNVAYQVGWNHGGANPYAATAAVATDIAAAPPLVSGNGVDYIATVTSGFARILGADHTGYMAAYQAGDYAQYQFTTSNSMSTGRFLKQLRYGVTASTATPHLPYKISMLFSNDPTFATASLAIDSHTVVAPVSGYVQTVVPLSQALYLSPSTTYYIRIIFHDVTSSTTEIRWDDLIFGFADCRDYGDAPAGYGTPTHAVLNGGTTLHLGTSVESEGAAWTSTGADGDNTNGLNDEDGVSAFLTLKGGSSATYTLPAANITALGTGKLYAWVDFNNNGTFDSNEFATTTVTANALAGDLVFSGFGTIAASGNTYARLRLTTDTLTSADAALAANNGEVEDYALTISPNNAPVINSDGGGAMATVSVSENQTTATTVIATDVDSDILTYSITGGADAALFTIDASTGVLTFNSAPDFESPTDADTNNAYEVQVTVVDGRGGITTQDLTLTVTDVMESLKLTVMGWLQGAYDANSGLMLDNLRSRGFIPSTQPYGQYPAFNYNGTETVSAARLTTTGTNAVVDWVLVELRNASDPTVIVAQTAALLTSDGTILAADTDSSELLFNLTPGSYYVVLRHRNHLAVMTQAPVALSTSSTTMVDFRLTATPVYGANARLENAAQALLWAGNSNLDQNVIAYGVDNDSDLILGSVLMAVGNTPMNSNYILPGYWNADLNLSGDVIFAGVNNDVNILAGNVLLHPNNSTFSANFVVSGTVPVTP